MTDRLQVYDVSKFLKLHPGGKKVLLGVGGQECTEQFNQFHNPAAVLAKYGPKLIVGELAGGAPKKEKAAAPAPAAAPKAQVAPSSPSSALTVSPAAPFGDQIPYGDASWSEHMHQQWQNGCARASVLVSRQRTAHFDSPFVADRFYFSPNLTAWLRVRVPPFL